MASIQHHSWPQYRIIHGPNTPLFMSSILESISYVQHSDCYRAMVADKVFLLIYSYATVLSVNLKWPEERRIRL